MVRRDPECMHLYDYAETWVKYLKNQGYHLYVLSNYGTYMLERTKKRYAVPEIYGRSGIFLRRTADQAGSGYL